MPAHFPRQNTVQVWCVPLRKPGATGPPSCKPDKIRSQLQIVLAQQVRGRKSIIKLFTRKRNGVPFLTVF